MSEHKLTAVIIQDKLNLLESENKFLQVGIEKLEAELEKYKKGYWGNPCEEHQKIEAWVTRLRVDEEGLHCFGCFLDSRLVMQDEGNRRLMEDMESFVFKIKELEAEVERLRGALLSCIDHIQHCVCHESSSQMCAHCQAKTALEEKGDA